MKQKYLSTRQMQKIAFGKCDASMYCKAGFSGFLFPDDFKISKPSVIKPFVKVLNLKYIFFKGVDYGKSKFGRNFGIECK